MRDNQRERVYRSESGISGGLVRPVEARRTVRELCKVLRIPVPKVELRKGGTSSFYKTNGQRIRILPSGNGLMRMEIVLHELAHHIVWVRHGGNKHNIADHGPEFARTEAALFTLMGLDLTGRLLRQFAENGVKLY